MRKDYSYRQEEQKKYQKDKYHSMSPERKLIKKQQAKVCAVKLRAEVLDLLGGECKWCHTKENLEVDHLKSNGMMDLAPNGKRVSGYHTCLRVRKHLHPQEEYQLLCETCNIKKHQHAPYVLTKELIKLGYTARQIDDLIKMEEN